MCSVARSCVHTTNYSYLTVIVVNEMHGRMHHNHLDNNFVDPCPPFIIDLLYNDPPPSSTRQFAYKTFGC